MSNFKKLLQFEFSDEICQVIDDAAKANGFTKKETFLRSELSKVFRQLPEQIPCKNKKQKKRFGLYVYDETMWNLIEHLSCRMSTNSATIVTALIIYPKLHAYLLEEKEKEKATPKDG